MEEFILGLTILLFIILMLVMAWIPIRRYNMKKSLTLGGNLTRKQLDKVHALKATGSEKYVELYNWFRVMNAETRRGRVLDLKGNVLDTGEAEEKAKSGL